MYVPENLCTGFRTHMDNVLNVLGGKYVGAFGYALAIHDPLEPVNWL